MEDFGILDNYTDELISEFVGAVNRYSWGNMLAPATVQEIASTLRNIVAELKGAREQGLLAEMPRSMRANLHALLTALYTEVQSANSGSSYQVQQVAARVDQLHTILWSGGFRFRGNRVVGYEAKVQQLNTIAKELTSIQQVTSEASTLLGNIRDDSTASSTLAEAISELASQAEAERGRLIAITQESDKLLIGVKGDASSSLQASTDASSHTADAKGHSDAAAKHEQRIASFVKSVDESEEALRTTIKLSKDGLDQTVTRANTFADEKDAQINLFLGRLVTIEEDIKQKLNKATGYTLFHSFDERQKNIRTHWIWLVVALLTLVATVGFVANVVKDLDTAANLTATLAIKLAISIPSAVIVGFCLKQYSRERRLKEEYAFKSAISLSLQPYQQLVRDAADTLDTADRTLFTKFLVSSITSIFDSPTDKVFGERRIGGPTDTHIVASFLKTAKEAQDTFSGKSS